MNLDLSQLIGHLGSNPEFIKAAIDAVGDSNEVLKEALGIKLDRQVGSRYFVSFRNAGRIFYHYLAVDFINNLALTKELNGLEKEVQASLQEINKLALLKADGLTES